MPHRGILAASLPLGVEVLLKYQAYRGRVERTVTMPTRLTLRSFPLRWGHRRAWQSLPNRVMAESR